MEQMGAHVAGDDVGETAGHHGEDGPHILAVGLLLKLIRQNADRFDRVAERFPQ